MRSQGTVFMLLAAAACAGVTGCGKDSDEVRYREEKGKVSAIDPATGVVEMIWFNPRKKAEQRLVGKLATEAEILIDGVTAKPEDVRIGDEVVVTVRVEKRDQLVATRVMVLRKETPDSQPSSGPASGPADSGGGIRRARPGDSACFALVNSA